MGSISRQSGTYDEHVDLAVEVHGRPIVAEVDGVRLRLHLRRLRGAMTLVEVARRGGLNRDELSRLERGETSQVRFSTLAKLLSVFDCSLDDLIEIERASAHAPLYAGALAALADGTIPAPGPGRRAVRRALADEVAAAADEASFAPSAVVRSDRRRSPVGTVHP